MRWFRIAAEHGHADAQTSLGLAHIRGEGVEQDFTAAAGWLLQAADAGVPTAQNNLALLYLRGDGVEKNRVEAHKWWTLAATFGDEIAAQRRDSLARGLSADELAASQAAVRAWMQERLRR